MVDLLDTPRHLRDSPVAFLDRTFRTGGWSMRRFLIQLLVVLALLALSVQAAFATTINMF